ncbi:MAG: ferrous iron transport protein A [Elusimicrobia bacterium]|nr:ferrous iron transport protein A [Elusimicrobiota bacterium]MDE2424898.1 ferrous iron transport protein A [Elusimicrobiota bacterium]
MTLAELPLQSRSRIIGLGGLPQRERHRLGALGLREGASIVKLLHTPLRDPVECLVGPQLLALEAWLLERIEVEAA